MPIHTFPDYYTWSARITLDSVDKSHLWVGEMTIEGEERSSKLAAFALRWNDDPDNLILIQTDLLINKPVTIDFQQDTGGAWERIFTGVVDEASYDPLTRLIEIRCTDDLQGYFVALGLADPDSVQTAIPGSKHSENIMGEYTDGWSRAEDCGSTVAVDFFKDQAGTYTTASWKSKATADYEFDSTVVVDGSVAIDTMTRSDMTNKVVIKLDYSYQRLHELVIQYTWEAFSASGFYPSDGSFGSFLQNPYALPSKDDIASAAEGSGWDLASPIGLVALPSPGDYGGIGWTPGVVARANIYQSAGFRLRRRWTRTRRDAYLINIQATDAITKYGVIPAEESVSVDIEVNENAWENAADLVTPTTLTGSGEPWDGFSFDGGVGGVEGEKGLYTRDDFDDSIRVNDIEVAMAVAEITIRQSLRQNYVTFDIPLLPGIERDKTVYLDVSEVESKGKVYQFEHLLNANSGVAITRTRTCHERGCDAASTDTLDVPGVPVVVDPLPTLDYGIVNRVGGVAGSPTYDENWVNAWVTNYSESFTTVVTNNPPADVDADDTNYRVVPVDSGNPDLYPEGMQAVKPDDIPDSMRDETLTAVPEVTYNVCVVADTFVLRG